MNGKLIDISTKTMVKFWLVIIGLVLVLGAVWLAKSAIIMILVAFFLAIVLNRPVAFFARVLPIHSRALGAVIVFIITLIVLGGVIFLMLPVFFEQFSSFAKSLPDTIASLEHQSLLLMDFARSVGMEETITSALNNMSNDISQIVANLGTTSVNIVTNIVNTFVNAGLVFVLTLFMLVEGPSWLDKFWKYAYKSAEKRARHKAIATKMYNVISSFVTSLGIIAAINGILAGIGVFVLGMAFGFTVSLILPIASVVFITTFIPIFGPFIGGGLAGVLVLLYNPVAAIILIAWLILYQQIVYNFLSPKIQGKWMNMSALLVLVAMVVGLQISGLFGALVAIPLTGCIVILVREVFKRYSQNTAVIPNSTKK